MGMGVGLGHEVKVWIFFFFFFFFFVKNDNLFPFQSRTEDHSPCLYAKCFTVLISKVYLIWVLSFIGDLRFNVRGEQEPGCMGRG